MAKQKTAEEKTRAPLATDNISRQQAKSAAVSTKTVAAEQTAAIPELNVTQATKPGIELYATSSGLNRTAVTDYQQAPKNKSTAKAEFGFRITVLVLVVLILSLILASLSFENGALVTFVEDRLKNDANIALDRDQTAKASKKAPVKNASTQDQAEIVFQQDLVEDASTQDQAEDGVSPAQAEIDILKQDLAQMQQKIKDMQTERDAALEKAKLEEERREREKQAALKAANRERDAQAAAALAAHKAKQAAQKAEKLAIQQRLEKQKLAEQRERLKQANQQAETRRNLLEEQRKLLVSEWERLAKEKARLDKASPDSVSE